MLLSAFFVSLSTAPSIAQGPKDRPNIVFLMSDDQATYTMGCYGNEDVQTPNLDGLARQGMKPTEELFQLDKDPLEMENLAATPEMRPALEQMRKKYDAQLKQWVDEAVNYNGYQQYGTLFDRNIPWETKAEVLATPSSKKAERIKKRKSKKPKPST